VVALQASMAVGKMRKVKCGTVISPHVRLRDCSYYAFCHTPRAAGAVVDCIMQMQKVALTFNTVRCPCNGLVREVSP